MLACTATVGICATKQWSSTAPFKGLNNDKACASAKRSCATTFDGYDTSKRACATSYGSKTSNLACTTDYGGYTTTAGA